MAELTGTPVYQNHVRQLETTDPKHPVTWNPNYQNLINNDVYLKQEQDSVKSEVLSARGGEANLDARLDVIEADIQAVDTGFQTGRVTIKNRGVIKGCIVSKSTDATRNLSLTAGKIFMLARIMPITGQINSASVPGNTSQLTKTCYVYLNSNLELVCTELDGTLPDGCMALYVIVVPAGNTEINDPYLTACTLSDLRRIEPNYPQFYLTSPGEYALLPYNFPDSSYIVEFEVESFVGSCFQLGYVYVGTKAVNGFPVYFNGTADSIVVAWTAIKLGA